MVEPRYDELFSLVQAELRRSGYEDLIAAGIVLTGGSSKMEGAVELAEEIFHMPVRLASPQTVTGLTEMVKNPIYATGVGLLKYGQKQVASGADAVALAGDQLLRDAVGHRFRIQGVGAAQPLARHCSRVSRFGSRGQQFRSGRESARHHAALGPRPSAAALCFSVSGHSAESERWPSHQKAKSAL